MNWWQTDSAKRTAAVVALCCAGVGAYLGVPGYEGMRTKPYRDASPAEIWTYCYGETKGVTANTPAATPEQCKAMLAARIEGDFIPGVEKCIARPMPVKVEAAFVSLAYNIGTGLFCQSSVARKWNAGDLKGACEAMKLYIKTGGKVLRGLVTRREGESQLCLEGIA